MWCIRKRAAILEAQGGPPLDKNFFRVKEFFLEEKYYLRMEAYDVIGLAQISYQRMKAFSPPLEGGKEGDPIYLQITEEILFERCQMNLLACALIPVPRRPGPGGRKLKKNPPIQRREGGSKNIEGIESNGLYL